MQPEILFIFILFPVIWIAMTTLISRLSGWAALAEVYQFNDSFSGETWRWQSGQMRWSANYGGCLTIGANGAGLYLSILFPFKVGHPPLFIPWTDITVQTKRQFLSTLVEFRFRRVPSLLRINDRLARRIQAAVGSAWPNSDFEQLPRVG